MTARELIGANFALTDCLAYATDALEKAVRAAAELKTGGDLEAQLRAMKNQAGALWELAKMYEDIHRTERRDLVFGGKELKNKERDYSDRR